MGDLQRIVLYFLVWNLCKSVTPDSESGPVSSQTLELLNSQPTREKENLVSYDSSSKGRSLSIPNSQPISNLTNKQEKQSNTFKSFSKRYDQQLFLENTPSKTTRFENFWFKNPYEDYSRRNETYRKDDHWPTWSSSKRQRHGNRNRNSNKKNTADMFEDYFGLESKLHEFMSDRKHIHEHEGFFFPIPLPTSHHHEKHDDHIIIPLLLLILIPLLLFAIIIPLNANLLSTLFLIMQNNGATATAAQLAAGRRKKRQLYTGQHPVIEERIVEILRILGHVSDEALL